MDIWLLLPPILGHEARPNLLSLADNRRPSKTSHGEFFPPYHSPFSPIVSKRVFFASSKNLPSFSSLLPSLIHLDDCIGAVCPLTFAKRADLENFTDPHRHRVSIFRRDERRQLNGWWEKCRGASGGEKKGKGKIGRWSVTANLPVISADYVGRR